MRLYSSFSEYLEDIDDYDEVDELELGFHIVSIADETA